MKKIAVIFFALIYSVAGLAQPTRTFVVGHFPGELPIGTFYSESQWTQQTMQSNFLVAGTANISLSNTGFLNIFSTTFNANNIVKILPNRPTDYNYWKLHMTFATTVWTTSSSEFGFVNKSIVLHNGANFGVACFIGTTNTGATNMFIYTEDRVTRLAGPVAAVTNHLNDVWDITFELADSTLTFSAINLTTTPGTTTVATYTYPSAMSTTLPVSANWGFWDPGDITAGAYNHQVRSLDISTQETKNLNLLIAPCNSKVKMGYANSWAGRIWEQLRTVYPTVYANAGSAEYALLDGSKRMQELMQYRPKQVLMLSSMDNDIGSGIYTNQQIVAGYEQLRAMFQSGGATVYDALLPEDSTVNGRNITWFKNYIVAQHPSTYIDTWDSLTTFSGGVSNNVLKNKYAKDSVADKVHLNQAGENQAVAAILAANKIRKDTTTRQTPFRTTDGLVLINGDSISLNFKMTRQLGQVVIFDTALNDGRLGLAPSMIYQNLNTNMVISNTNSTPVPPLNTIIWNVNGAMSVYGNQASIFLYDKTNSTNFWTIYSNTNNFRFNYNGSDLWGSTPTGQMQFGGVNKLGVTNAQVSIRPQSTYALSNTVFGNEGFMLNVDTATIQFPSNFAHSVLARFAAPTYTGQTSTRNMTDPITVLIEGAPIAGTNAAFQNNRYAFKVLQDSSFFGGVVQLGANLSINTGSAFMMPEGANGRVGQTTLISGTKTISITGITASSRAFITLVSPSGVTLTTTYQAVCTSNQLVIQANVAAGTINTADGSTINYFVIN